MENDLPNAAGDSAPVNDSLRASLESAFEQHREAPVAETQETDEAAERARDERGRFAKSEQEAAEAVKQAEATTQPPEGETPPEATPAPATPPPGWSVASKAVFDTLPDSVKADIAKREAEVSAGFETYKGLGEFVSQAKSIGMEPREVIANYQRAEQLLDTDFVGGVAFLCQNYGIHPHQLAQALTGQQQPTQTQAAPTQQADPNAALLQKVQSLEQRIEGERRAKVTSETEAFFSNPAHKYAPNVTDQMITLINGAKSEGRNLSLKEAYDAAVWLNPETRQQLLNEQLTARNKAEADKANAAAINAKKAAASVTGSPVHGASARTASSQNNSLRDDILSAMQGARV
jgi:hypothetical protein